MATPVRTTAFDSGKRVVVLVDPRPEMTTPVSLSLGESDDGPSVSLSEREAERIIEALTQGLERLRRLRTHDPRD